MEEQNLLTKFTSNVLVLTLKVQQDVYFYFEINDLESIYSHLSTLYMKGLKTLSLNKKAAH